MNSGPFYVSFLHFPSRYFPSCSWTICLISLAICRRLFFSFIPAFCPTFRRSSTEGFLPLDDNIEQKYNVLHGGDDMAFSIRLTEDERKLAESYAKLHSFSLAEAFKRALFEKIEDEFDIAVANEAYREYLDSGCQSTPVADFWRELDEEISG